MDVTVNHVTRVSIATVDSHNDIMHVYVETGIHEGINTSLYNERIVRKIFRKIVCSLMITSLSKACLLEMKSYLIGVWSKFSLFKRRGALAFGLVLFFFLFLSINQSNQSKDTFIKRSIFLP